MDTEATTAAVVLEGALADRDAWRADRCPIDAALQVVGTRSALLILREAAYGTRKFDEFVRRVGITEAVTAARLRQLTDAGLLRREPYQEAGQRTRFEYHLTEQGQDLMPALLALLQWGARYLSGPKGPALDLRHTVCDTPVRVEVICAEGHPVPLAELSIRPAARPRGARRTSA
jgi:DNA-binding HxlR family transcriptional regulator